MDYEKIAREWLNAFDLDYSYFGSLDALLRRVADEQIEMDAKIVEKSPTGLLRNVAVRIRAQKDRKE